MYLSKKQINALRMALEAMEYRNSGALDDEQAEAYDIIAAMLNSGRKAQNKHINKMNRGD
jgi:hypothetical protein